MNDGIIAHYPACTPAPNLAGAEWKSFRRAASIGAQKRCKNPPEICRGDSGGESILLSGALTNLRGGGSLSKYHV